MHDLIQKDRRCGHGPATHPRLFDISTFKSNLNYAFYGIFYNVFSNRGLRYRRPLLTKIEIHTIL